MKLKEVLSNLNVVEVFGNVEVDVSIVCWDTRLLWDDSIFVVRTSGKFNPFECLAEILTKAKCIICSDADKAKAAFAKNSEICFVVVKDVEKESFKLIDIFFQNIKNLKIVGVTGTNGKTTIINILRHVFESAGRKSGVIGTVSYQWGETKIKSFMTTPDVFNLTSLCGRMASQGVENIFIEVSSHALEQGRLQGINLFASIFTNLTPEHLDFHKTMGAYAKAKNIIHSLLDQKGFAVINTEDTYSSNSAEGLNRSVVKVGRAETADYKLINSSSSLNGVNFIIENEEKQIELSSKLIGLFNVYNLSCVVATAHKMGIDFGTIKDALNTCSGVPGRLENIVENVYVDYAHTPDALNKVLTVLRESGYDKIITVFGCGGDRDRIKRVLMAETVECFSNRVVVTDDNPRTEDPEQIFDDIKKGFKKDIHTFIHDRKEAIFSALAMKKDQSTVVLIAGKGHEDCQVLKNQTIFISDKDLVKEYYDINT